MNRETIIQMAREAGAGAAVTMSGIAAAEFRGGALERFAALVAAKEREECAKVCEDMHDEDRPTDYAWAIRARGEA